MQTTNETTNETTTQADERRKELFEAIRSAGLAIAQAGDASIKLAEIVNGCARDGFITNDNNGTAQRAFGPGSEFTSECVSLSLFTLAMLDTLHIAFKPGGDANADEPVPTTTEVAEA